VSVAKQSIERIGSVLDMYKLDVGTYPDSEQGLRALVERPTGVEAWNGPYLKGGVPVDPWNHPYTYRNPSPRSGHDYDLCSAGPPTSTASTDAICNPELRCRTVDPYRSALFRQLLRGLHAD
jgi:general secretion pathway protein G